MALDGLLRICYLLMAALFALSASFQFNDPDWYFWIPLYSTACIANLVNGSKPEPSIRKMGNFALWLGVFLFIKVFVKDLVSGRGGFLCVDMRERGVREKFGSGLVVISMFLVLKYSSGPNHHSAQLTKYGMVILVGVAYSLSFFFFTFQHHQMRYNSFKRMRYSN